LQFHGLDWTVVALAVGPDRADRIDAITGMLPLL
jgi:hypothetical protein